MTNIQNPRSTPLQKHRDLQIHKSNSADATTTISTETTAESITAQASAAATEQMSKTLTVLLVEDDPVFSHLVSRYLKHDKKHRYEIERCGSAAEAMDLSINRNYDVLLVDQLLPDYTGTQFLDELRKAVSGPIPPSIVFTADANGKVACLAHSANASDFLMKNVVSTASLSRSIQNAISKFTLQKAINQRTAELEKLNSNLKAKNREIRDYYQKVSHEVKTPLAAAREFISIVHDGIVGPVPEEMANILRLAIISCDQIKNHFNDLVQISRLDAGKIFLRKKETTVEQVLKRAQAATAATLAESSMPPLLQNIENPKTTALLDEDRIVQVVSNLISNAIKFSDKGATISVRTRKNAEGDLEFRVSDQGCGIAEEHRLKIFERLYQVFDESHESLGSGLGLGLAIGSEIVQLHQGKIWVESELGKGSQFYFTIPRNLIQVW